MIAAPTLYMARSLTIVLLFAMATLVFCAVSRPIHQHVQPFRGVALLSQHVCVLFVCSEHKFGAGKL